MGFVCGIVGLPNVGKSTLFNALTRAGAKVNNYPFCTIDPNRGVVPVPDARLDRLAEMLSPEKTTPTTLTFLDIAGLVRGAHQGDGLGNEFLGHIRNVDAVAHVVRCFEHADVVHVEGDVDPARDVDILDTELLMADLQTAENRIEKVGRHTRSGDKAALAEVRFLEDLRDGLAGGKPAAELRPAPDTPSESFFNALGLLTDKPVLFVANVDEGQLKQGAAALESLRAVAAARQAPVVPIIADMEAEIAELEDPEEAAAFLQDLGLSETGLNPLVRAGYDALSLITFYTTVGPELRAWTVPKGTKAPRAAGRIHTDFEKGFIRAEVIPFDRYVQAGSEAKARESGILRVEGKDYEVRDGDVIRFKFNT